jgi:Mrr N-terminal domain
MKTEWIEVDGDVIDAIKDVAEPFVDNPNRALRRVFGLPAIENDRTAPLPSSIPRAPRGSLLPLAEFEVPILLAVSEAGGSAARSVVMDAVWLALKDRLSDLDQIPMSSGLVRWRTRVDQARQQLVKRSLLESGQPGIWKLTEAGTEYLDRRLKSKAAAERSAAQ